MSQHTSHLRRLLDVVPVYNVENKRREFDTTMARDKMKVGQSFDNFALFNAAFELEKPQQCAVYLENYQHPAKVESRPIPD